MKAGLTASSLAPPCTHRKACTPQNKFASIHVAHLKLLWPYAFGLELNKITYIRLVLCRMVGLNITQSSQLQSPARTTKLNTQIQPTTMRTHTASAPQNMPNTHTHLSSACSIVRCSNMSCSLTLAMCWSVLTWNSEIADVYSEGAADCVIWGAGLRDKPRKESEKETRNAK